MIHQINVKQLWRTMELVLSAKNGKLSTITIDNVCQGDSEFTRYVVNNLGEEFWDNPLYLALVVERLYKICGEPVEYMPLYWLGDEPKGKANE